MTEFLIAATCIIGLLGSYNLFKADRIFGAYFFFLFIYGFFPLVGYQYFPELSVVINAYFGEEIWMESALFVILSLLCFILAYNFLGATFFRYIPIQLVVGTSKNKLLKRRIASAVLSFVFLFVFLYSVANPEQINWYSAQDAVNVSLGYTFFLFVYKNMTACCVALYCLHRQNKLVHSKSLSALYVAIFILLFLITSFNLGNRTDVLSLMLAIIIYESYTNRLDLQRLLKYVAIALLFLLIMSLIEGLRYTDQVSKDTEIASALIAKDYYYPAHMLFAAVKYGIVDPVEVLISNTSNALIMINQPYLQQTVTDYFLSEFATRTQGFAFYVFTEGYMVMGGAGFIYNGIVLVLFLVIWRRIAATNDTSSSIAMLSLMGTMLVGLTRGQTAYFIKGLYFYVLPGFWIYLWLSGKKSRLIIKNYNYKLERKKLSAQQI